MRVEVWSGNRQLAQNLARLGIESPVAARHVVLVADDDADYAREVIAVALEYGPAAEGGA